MCRGSVRAGPILVVRWWFAPVIWNSLWRPCFVGSFEKGKKGYTTKNLKYFIFERRLKKITRTWNYSDFILHSEKYITFLSELCTMELVPWSNLKDLQIFECKFWYWFLPLFRIIHLYKKNQVDVIDQRLNFCLIFMQNLKFNFRACYSERLSWRTVSVNAVLRLKKKLDLGPKIPYQALTPYIHKGH